MIEVLVTGGAGFIGSNFVRHALAAHRRLAHHDARQADLRRPHRDAARRDGPPAPHLRPRRHRDARGRGAAGRARGHRRPLRGRDARRPVDLGGRRLHPHRRDRHLRAARGRAQRAAPEAVRPDLDRRGLRQRGRRMRAARPTSCRPRNPYSASKAGADRLAYSYFATYGVPVIITRASNNYGPYQFPEKIIPLFVTNAIDDLPLPLYGDGRNVRDWLHVDGPLPRGRSADRARRQRRDLQRRRRQRDSQRRSDAPHSGRRGPAAHRSIQPVKDRPGHDRRYSLDTSKARALGWAPQVDFADGLRETDRLVSRPTSGGGVRSRKRTPRSRPTTRRSTAGASASR